MLSVRDRHEAMVDVAGAAVGRQLALEAGGEVRVLPRQLADLAVERRGEEHRLPVVAQLADERSTCGLKPMSSMRSASSSTSTSTASRSTSPRSTRSCSRPGVATITCASFASLRLRLQRHAAVDRRDLQSSPAISANSSVTCTQSSRVGTSTSANGVPRVVALDDRDRECERLARAGRALREHVAAPERLRDDERSGSGTGRRCRARRARSHTASETPRERKSVTCLNSFGRRDHVSDGGDEISRERGPSAFRENHGSSGLRLRGSRVFEQAQPVLELRDPQLELVPFLARDEAELARQVLQRRLLPSPTRSASPRQRDVTSSSSERASSRRRPSSVTTRSSAVAVGAIRARPWGRVLRRWRRALRASRRSRRRRRVLDRRRSASPASARRRRPPRPAEQDPLADRAFHRAAVLAARVLGLALLPGGQQRRRDEDRRVGTRGDADEQREREVLQRRAAEEEQRARPAAG